MKKRTVILFLSLAALLTTADAQSSYTWKETDKEIPEQALNNPQHTEGIEIFTRQGTLIVRTPVKTTVKVLTILGQTISQTVINAGTYEMNIGTHGIFIVRVGDYTLRVAL